MEVQQQIGVNCKHDAALSEWWQGRECTSPDAGALRTDMVRGQRRNPS